MKVIFHIDDNANWKLVLANTMNLIKAGKEIGEKYDIEVLANGNSVITLKKQIAMDSDFYNQFEELKKENVVFAACNNSLNNLKISKQEMLSFVQVVPAGVLELAKKQEEGYRYIKP